MKPTLKKAGLRLSFGLIVWNTFLNATGQTDQSSFNPSTTQDSIKSPSEKIIEISKINSGKTFVFKPGKIVWVEGRNKNGKKKIIKAEITEIGDHQITFTPISRKFKQIVSADSTLNYIGFTTTSSAIIATTATIVLLPVCLIVTLLTQTPVFIVFPARKDINFYNTLNGEKKWNIRITAR